MSDSNAFPIITEGVGPQVAVGTRVSLPTNDQRTGFDVVPDENGTHVVVSCEPGTIRVRRFEAGR